MSDGACRNTKQLLRPPLVKGLTDLHCALTSIETQLPPLPGSGFGWLYHMHTSLLAPIISSFTARPLTSPPSRGAGDWVSSLIRRGCRTRTR